MAPTNDTPLAGLTLAGPFLRGNGAPRRGLRRYETRAELSCDLIGEAAAPGAARRRLGTVELRNEADVAEVLVYGVISPDPWDANAKDFDAALRDVEGACCVRINSPGGSLAEGLAMHNIIAARRSSGMTTQVDSIAASAGAIVFLGADDRLVPRDAANIMIHQVMTALWAWGNVDELRAEWLRTEAALMSLDSTLARIIGAKLGIEPSAALVLMQAETWYSADEAIAAGMATGYTGDDGGDGDGEAAATSRLREVADIYRAWIEGQQQG